MNPLRYYKTLRQYANVLSPGILLDCIWCRLRYGVITEQYFALNFHKKSGRERKTYVSRIYDDKLRAVINKVRPEEREALCNKYIFNRVFHDYIRREYLLTEESTEDEIRAFVDKHEKVLVKPLNLTQGKGIRLLTRADLSEEICADLASKGFLMEEYIRQHHLMAQYNADSVNSVRIMTLKDAKGRAHLLGACLRIGGKGSVVDNFHSGGICYPLDLEHGIVCAPGAGTHGVSDVVFHPSTQKCVLGFQVPHWELLCQTVLEASKLTALRVVGWDVAVTETGVMLIEANVSADFTVIQIAGGVKARVEEILKEG